MAHGVMAYGAWFVDCFLGVVSMSFGNMVWMDGLDDDDDDDVAVWCVVDCTSK